MADKCEPPHRQAGYLEQRSWDISRTYGGENIRRLRRNAMVEIRARHMEQQTETEQATKELEELDEMFNNVLSDTARDLTLSLGVTEVVLLMSGSFLWGFGDLFFV